MAVPAEAAMVIGADVVPRGELESIPCENPATEEPLPAAPHAGAGDVDRAVRAARAASGAWGASGWAERAHALREIARRVREEAEWLAECDVDSTGLTLAAARNDVEAGCRSLEYFGSIAAELTGTVFPPGAGAPAYALRKPYGVVARILAFNHPAQFALGKMAAPLAAGNAVVLKPAERSPYAATRIAQIAQDVLGPGTVNVVTGEGQTTGRYLVEHPDVQRIAATGGLGTGQAILKLAADGIKHVSLELGGKNPLIAFPDVDVDEVADAIVRGMNFTACQGQSCGSTSRVYLHADIHDAVADAVIDRVGKLTVGPPREPSSDMGPLAFRAHYERVLGYVDHGQHEGATLAIGGTRPAGLDTGYYLEPSVFTGVTDDMAIAREEIFGPVLSLLRWTSRADMLAAVNASPFALTASVWTNDVRTANEMAQAVDAGLLWINQVGRRDLSVPWGGHKASGLGQEYGMAELASFTTETSVMFG